jgi:hypothetical protein
VAPFSLRLDGFNLAILIVSTPYLYLFININQELFRTIFESLLGWLSASGNDRRDCRAGNMDEIAGGTLARGCGCILHSKGGTTAAENDEAIEIQQAVEQLLETATFLFPDSAGCVFIDYGIQRVMVSFQSRPLW